METKELRIGNYIQKNGLNATVEIINGEVDEVFYLGDDFYYSDNIDDLRATQLTEEWLLKFGFKIIDDNPKQKPQYKGDIIFKILEFEFSNSDKSNNNNGFYCYEINNGNTIINYVHQLQNLYFALVGSELQLHEADA